MKILGMALLTRLAFLAGVLAVVVASCLILDNDRQCDANRPDDPVPGKAFGPTVEQVVQDFAARGFSSVEDTLGYRSPNADRRLEGD